MISFPRLFKQQINYIEKANKEHSINGSFWNSESVKPLSRKMIHCFKVLQSDRVSRIIWFRTGLQRAHRESFELDPPCIHTEQKYKRNTFVFAPVFHELNSKI